MTPELVPLTVPTETKVEVCPARVVVVIGRTVVGVIIVESTVVEGVVCVVALATDDGVAVLGG
jgi:hypothetical protein